MNRPAALISRTLLVGALAGFGAVARADDAATAAQAPAPQAAAKALPPLRYLPNNAQGLRLTGEIATSQWPIYLTKAQAAEGMVFQLGYLSAISDLPEDSTVQVEINGVSIGTAPINAPYRVKKVRFKVPPKLVRPGFNALTIVASQRHRADCSLKATFELWMQIDATTTGFMFSGKDPGVIRLNDLPAVPPDRHGGMPIRMVLPTKTTTEDINQALKAVELTAIRGRFEQPIIDIGPGLASGAGINVAVGTYDALGKMADIGTLNYQPHGQIKLLPGSDALRPTLVVAGRNHAEIDQALQRLAIIRNVRGTVEGLRAVHAFPGYAVDGGTRVKLRDLGVISQQFNGRMFRATFSVIMPSDFYPADTAQVALDLNGGYAPRLSTQAKIVIRVNNRIAVGSNLGRSSGALFNNRRISFPLGMMQPGLNTISLEAQLPGLVKQPCTPMTDAKARQRFLLLDSSTLVIPQIAHVALSPNLAVTATGAFPYAVLVHPPSLVLPQTDPDTIAAAATIAARMAVSANRAIDFKVTTHVPARANAPVMLVGPQAAFNDATLALAGINPAKLRKAWPPVATPAAASHDTRALSRFERQNAARIALERNYPVRCALGAATFEATSLPVPAPVAAKNPATPASPEAINVAAGDQTLESSWQYKNRVGHGWFSATWLPHLHLSTLTGLRLAIWRSLKAGTAHILTGLAPQKSVNVITPTASLLVGQGSNGSTGLGIWTLVTARNAISLRRDAACLVDPRVWNQLHGAISALNLSEARIDANDSSRLRFIQTRPFTFGNTRLITAGWFSHNIWAYIGLVLVTALSLGGMTRMFVRRVGRPT
ncbi:MAG: cellulose biosynthesis cyclic di-GMP-binding regulatory protein BcsB [Hyphomicrobiales bacterium]|nr:cellulose biosynthesis cyclic di-GMP-binding regulatory protein BcsB [Hyphomicrobiales bacterium]